jgi:hypothetical protein
MNHTEKFCLKWNDFRENVQTAFRELREDRDFADVTLACEDGHQVEAHKVILAASSPFFQDILRRNKHPHPLIYMRGLKAEDLVAIVDFLYCGEANIYQENLDVFLNIAEELKLKGLAGKTFKNNVEEKPKPKPNHPLKVIKPKEFQHETQSPNHAVSSDTTFRMDKAEVIDTSNGIIATTEYSVRVDQEEFSDLQELDEKVKSMMAVSQVTRGSKGSPARVCTVCGKEGQWTAIRDHIEANHISGVSHPCDSCEVACTTRNGLRKHNKSVHSNK